MDAKAAIEKLFYPGAIAVIGASDTPDKFSGRALKHLIKSNFKGGIFPVNPNRREVQGLPCYRNIKDIPGRVDLAVIMVPNSLLFEALEDCRLKSVSAALVLNSGFAETGKEGRHLQERLGAFAKQTGIRVCGPNCNGYVNILQSLIVGTSGAFDRPEFVPGDIAFLVQSGGVAGMLFDLAQEKRIGLSYCVSVGNEADLDVADFIEYMADDPKTKVIGLFVEGIQNGRRFLSVLEKAQAKGKFVVVCKAGKSAVGQAAAGAHTGKLAGSSRVWSAAMRQSGVIEVDDLEDLVESCNLVSKFGSSDGASLAILTLSGGQGVLLADLCESLSIRLPSPSPRAAEALRDALPEFAALSNPIDLTGQASGSPEVLEQLVLTLSEDVAFDAVLLVLVASPVAARLWTDRIAKVASAVSKPLVVLWSGGRGLDAWRNRLLECGVPVFTQATVCIRSLSCYLTTRKRLPASDREAHPDAALARRAGAFLENKMKQGIAEPEAKELVKFYGIPVPQEFLAQNEEDAVEAFRRLGGHVAMKVISPAILHRSEGGFVRLAVSTVEQARECYCDLMARASSLHPEASLQGVLVQEMIWGNFETLAGISHDLQFGPAVLFGSGGITAELLDDVALRLCPLSHEDCYEMIAETKAGKLLMGFRGQPQGDIEGVVNVLMALSNLACGVGPLIKEMDINPLIVRGKGQGVVAVDVRLMVPGDFRENAVP